MGIIRSIHPAGDDRPHRRLFSIPAQRIASRAFVPLLLLGIVDRLLLLFTFGFRYVGDDDGIVWSAAIDYAHGRFHEPYFYGQDYAVMLEALVAAPFTWLGVPLNILMPVVTSLLALAPYWSFAAWHRKHGRPGAALVFLAMPVLLPVEFGLMTTITRCFIPGIALLSFLPWITDGREGWRKHFLAGLVLSAAAFVNPNSLVFGVAWGAWHILSSPRKGAAFRWVLLGTLPFAIALVAAQWYCITHPERMMNGLNGWRMTFHPIALIPESLGMLDTHFRWLFPLLPTVGCLTFLALPALLLHLRGRNRVHALALTAALVLILISFAFPKTHDGRDNVFFPYSRMYLAMPLLLCWGAAALTLPRRWAAPGVPALLVACVWVAGLKSTRSHSVINWQITGLEGIVSERPLEDLRADAHALQQISREHHVGLIMGHGRWGVSMPSQYRCYLYPVLEPSLPPTYYCGRDRRYWQRDAFATRVVPNILLIGGDTAGWGACMRADPRIMDLSTSTLGQVHLIRDNTEPTDSLAARLLHLQDLR